MYLDSQAQFDDAASHLTTEASTNILDLGAIRDIGVGKEWPTAAASQHSDTSSGQA